MYAVGYDRPLLSWILQSPENICLSFFKLWLGPLRIKPLRRPCFLFSSFLCRGWSSHDTGSTAGARCDTVFSGNREGEEPILLGPSERNGPAVEVILSSVLTEVVSPVRCFIWRRRIFSLRRWKNSKRLVTSRDCIVFQKPSKLN